MPIYEYQCHNCHHQIEVLQSFSDPPPTNCPECGKNSLVKMVSASGFQLTGSGWYATDFKDKKPQPIATENASDKTEKKVEAKVETKVEKKTAEEK